jgi:hypothetical protein
MIFQQEVKAEQVKFTEEAKQGAKAKQTEYAYGKILQYRKEEDQEVYFVMANINNEPVRLEEGMWIVDFGGRKKVLSEAEAEKHLVFPEVKPSEPAEPTEPSEPNEEA